MKRAVRGFSLSVGFGLIAVLGLLAVCPSGPDGPGALACRSLQRPNGDGPRSISCAMLATAAGVRSDVAARRSGGGSGQAGCNIALATPRTRGSQAARRGRITWITRSALMGFPDYTTVQVLPSNGAVAVCRMLCPCSVSASSDLGVNARAAFWLGRLVRWQGRCAISRPGQAGSPLCALDRHGAIPPHRRYGSVGKTCPDHPPLRVSRSAAGAGRGSCGNRQRSAGNIPI